MTLIDDYCVKEEGFGEEGLFGEEGVAEKRESGLVIIMIENSDQE